jgi:arylsulfatase
MVVAPPISDSPSAAPRVPRARPRLVALAALLAACGGGDPPPRVLLLVTVDTLRADRLGAYGSDLGLTPHLDALAAESQVFEAAYAPAPFTLPSLAGLLTGRYPEAIGIWSNESQLAEGVPTLAGELRERGWSTGAVVGNWVLRRGAGLAAGFDRYDDELEAREAVRGWPERVAAETTDAALRMLDALDARAAGRLLWVHYQDPHGPYTPPPEHRERHLARERAAPDGALELPLAPDHTGEGAIPVYQALGARRDVAFYRAGYDGEVSYLDEQIGRLVEGLRARGALDGALVAFAADHGESLGEGGHWFVHGARLAPELVHVPCFLRVPGAPPRRRSDVVSLVDLRATLLAWATGAAPSSGPGRDLLAPGAEGAIGSAYLAALASSPESRVGWIEGDYQLTLVHARDVWDAQLVRRGREQVDLSAAAPQQARHMRERLNAFRESFRDAPAERRQLLSEADAERLRALGYAPER